MLCSLSISTSLSVFKFHHHHLLVPDSDDHLSPPPPPLLTPALTLPNKRKPLTSVSKFTGYGGRRWETDQCW
ncbi:hypothetical protein HRI_004154800 [Hibiscus trionum]|uniref:Uncharacterized protein n=1 Tax=Hibiscus trionum TaxID=183268 RepID=A0A9W7MPN0_HIBTR|nr:hypothetical protein HRI_004154800 [Hibiscus trionum]